MISPVVTAVQRVSFAMKPLNIGKFRVIATWEVVAQGARLKTSVLGVTGSMGAPQDWETVANF